MQVTCRVVLGGKNKKDKDKKRKTNQKLKKVECFGIKSTDTEESA